MATTTFVKVSCHCGLNTFQVAFATESLPYSSEFCHCSSCRHSTGVPACQFVPADDAPLAPSSTDPGDLSTLTSYKTSETGTRYFCGRCSTHIFCQFLIDSKPLWCIAAGTLERTEGIIKPSQHLWLEDTLDGGLADFLPSIDGVELTRCRRGDQKEVLPAGWSNLPSAQLQPGTEDRLHAYCHCKANSFYITRPSAASFEASSPYPDLSHAVITTLPEIGRNPGDEKWWLRPAGSDKPTHFLAGTCACTSCRKISGFEIQCWAFLPCANILVRNPATNELEPVELRNQEKRPSGLRHYNSSPGRHREFCATCGATVFWWGDERDGLIDFSVGLIDEKQNGARAEGWFDWWKQRVSFEEDAIHRSVIRGLEEGLLKASKA
ncbi:hypothetical protein H0H92_007549 [Tricholoma furcatifolium]|nr:hypothetical protein H0H92_007549 [Tricholoma furcatifolium]